MVLPVSETFYAVGVEARTVGLPFEGHLPTGVNPIQAVNAGYRSIEHLGPGDTILTYCSTDEASLKAETFARPLKKPPPVPEQRFVAGADTGLVTHQ